MAELDGKLEKKGTVKKYKKVMESIGRRSCTETTKEQYEIYNALGIKETPLAKLII